MHVSLVWYGGVSTSALKVKLKNCLLIPILMGHIHFSVNI